MSQGYRIAFAGTPEFAVPAFEALAATGHDIPFVLTQPDRPQGRGRVMTPSPVARAARQRSLRIVQPERPTREAFVAEASAPLDLVVVVAYGCLLPGWFLDWPRLGCVNLHASLLPRWRGAAPIQRAIAAGDTETGICLMKIVSKLDAGPVYARKALAIGAEETAGELHDRLAALGAALLREVLPSLLAGELEPTPQPAQGVTYAHKLEKAEAELDWREPAVALARRIRAFNPWPVAEGRLDDGRRLRLWAGEAIGLARAAPVGTIVAEGSAGIDVATGDGGLRLTLVQAPGGRTMQAGEYVRAHPLTGRSFVH